MTENNPTRDVVDWNNRCLVLYRSESDGALSVKYPRDFPPRRTYPIAVLSADRDVIRLTADPLPGTAELIRLVQQLAAPPAETEKHDATRLRPGTCCEVEPRPSRLDLEWAAGRYLHPHTTEPVVLAVDISGGMNPALTEPWARRFAQSPNCTVVCFDHTLAAYDPARELPRGGGTNFALVQRYVEALAEHPQVVVVTDGYAPHISPAQPEKWTWALTPDGDPWPARRDNDPMGTFFIDTYLVD